MLLTGDLGYSVFEEFRDRFPRQYLNAGVAEQNMIGTAAGLAMSGKRVFAYSIVPFVTFRCLEQVRDDVCHHHLPVCVVGVGGGYSYGHLGATHHALEDIAVMRSVPNMTVVCPGDPLEAQAAVHSLCAYDGPSYLRLGKNGEPIIHHEDLDFVIGKAIPVIPHGDITLVSTGAMLPAVMETAALLLQKGIAARVVSMHTVKPLDVDALRQAAAETKLIVTIEEHSIIGGLGGAVAEALSVHDIRIRHVLCAAPDAFAHAIGTQQYLRAQAGLTPEAMCERICEALKN